MIWADDGYYKKVVILKAKNYVLYDPENTNLKKRLMYKGSAFKDAKKEPALRQFMKDVISEILNETYDYLKVYDRYVKEILDVKDMSRWCTKKTYTPAVSTSKRTNETKVLDAIAGTEYVEGDKFYVFYLEDKSLCLLENFKGEYDKSKLLKRLYDTIKIFDNIIDISVFPNYNLKRNKGLLNLE